MPSAARSVAESLVLFSADITTLWVRSQISTGLCSTQPARAGSAGAQAGDGRSRHRCGRKSCSGCWWCPGLSRRRSRPTGAPWGRALFRTVLGVCHRRARSQAQLPIGGAVGPGRQPRPLHHSDDSLARGRPNRLHRHRGRRGQAHQLQPGASSGVPTQGATVPGRLRDDAGGVQLRVRPASDRHGDRVQPRQRRLSAGDVQPGGSRLDRRSGLSDRTGCLQHRVQRSAPTAARPRLIPAGGRGPRQPSTRPRPRPARTGPTS